MANEQSNIIGKGITIRGNLSGGGDLVIEGQVEGQINLKNHLTIETTGKVQADIRAEELTINGEEHLVIQGTVKGKISLKESLFVEGTGVVEADIDTQNVEIAGRVTGNIAASDKVELRSDCRVVGDIRAPRILIADGASFKGNVDM